MKALSYIALSACVAGCLDGGAPHLAVDEGAITVRIGTSLLHDVPTDAHYRVTVFDGAGAIVDQQVVAVSVDDVAELRMACDPASTFTRVHIAFEGLSGALAPQRDFVGPIAPLMSDVDCRAAGKLIATTFPFTRPTLAPEASDFGDNARYCSAKLRVQDLLFNPARDERESTAILGFACVDFAGRPMTLWMDELGITGADGSRPRAFASQTFRVTNERGEVSELDLALDDASGRITEGFTPPDYVFDAQWSP